MNQDEDDVSFFPITGLLMLFLQFGQLKGPTPRGSARPPVAAARPRGSPEAQQMWLPGDKPCFVKYRFSRMA